MTKKRPSKKAASSKANGKAASMLELHIILAADLKVIDPVVRGVMEIIRHTQCVHSKESEIELALAEALSNAVVHGAKADSKKRVECDVACNPEGMLIVVRDPGPGFDPKAVPSPVAGENIFSSHGRGIYLINQLMDEVHFTKNGTEIHMVKR
ncbi:MAG: ATP-binding protein [Acidobacteriales bacterium]|nr:ATP-binding protein [Terriglobales bacterium]